MRGTDLRLGKSQSCGCLSHDRAAEAQWRHGWNDTPEYRTWSGMVQRCTNQNNPAFKHYGGRGISVCDAWLHDVGALVRDMGPRPSPEHSLDRIDVNGNYEPSNCRWATHVEQANNARSNRILVVNGRSMTLSQWARETGVRAPKIWKRLHRGWIADRAVLTP